jgi:hypothetical protein
MSEDESNKEVKSIASAIVSVLNKDTKDFISLWVFIFAPIFFMLALFWFFKFISDLGEVPEKCWGVKVLKEQIVRINECTGEIKKVEPNEISSK